MSNYIKSRETLLKELEELQQENNRLKASIIDSGIATTNNEELEFRRTEDFHLSILQTSMDGFLLVDKETKILEVNEAYCRMSGYSVIELTTMRVSDLEVMESAEEITEHLRKVILYGDDRFDTRHRRKDGSVYDIEISVMHRFFDQGRFIIFLRDISDRKRSELSLHESETNYRSLVETAQELVWKCDSTGNFIYLNPSWEKTHGYKLEEMLGKPFSEFLPPANREKDLGEFKKLLNNKVLTEYETNHIARNGKVLTLLFNAIPLLDQSGNVIGTQGTAIDITRRKEEEAELIIAKEQAEQSDKLKSAFLANMSHEIRTPMNGILGFAELLKESKLSGEEQHEYIEIIEKSGARMLNIINDIVDISKIESGQMKVHIQESNINDQIEYMHTFFLPEAKNKGLKFFIQNPLSSKESTIFTDREKLFAILTNLIKNAIKFCDKGSIKLGYLKKGSELEFFVTDTGIGIDKQRQEVIFDRFSQADNYDSRATQGSGLGLAITKAYVEMLGGKIWVASVKDKGSTFYFTLPYNIRPEERATSKQIGLNDQIKRPIKKLKILIAEDDQASEKLLSILVNPYIKELFIATTGIEAVETCRSNPDIELVLMDIQMPEMNGYDATHRIRQFNRKVIIIAQTAYGLVGDREKALDAGCNDYISKPIKIDRLTDLITKYIN